MSDSQNWYFTAETNAKGYTYIKAYQTKWDPVRKRSHSFNRRHVGRLHDDGRVVPSKAFLEQFPQYAGFPLFYPENRGIYTQSDSSKKSSRNIWSLAVVSVDQRY